MVENGNPPARIRRILPHPGGDLARRHHHRRRRRPGHVCFPKNHRALRHSRPDIHQRNLHIGFRRTRRESPGCRSGWSRSSPAARCRRSRNTGCSGRTASLSGAKCRRRRSRTPRDGISACCSSAAMFPSASGSKPRLRESEEKYRLIADNTAETITVLDLDLKFTYVSPSIFKLRGYTVEESLNQTLQQTLTPDSLARIQEVFSEEMALEASGKRQSQAQPLPGIAGIPQGRLHRLGGKFPVVPPRRAGKSHRFPGCFQGHQRAQAGRRNKHIQYQDRQAVVTAAELSRRHYRQRKSESAHCSIRPAADALYTMRQAEHAFTAFGKTKKMPCRRADRCHRCARDPESPLMQSQGTDRQMA